MELHLYDFDGTLFRSPDAPGGMDVIKWIMHPGSLEEPCVPAVPGPEWWIASTVASAQRSIAHHAVHTILATGRALSVFQDRVPQLLKDKGLLFDEVHLSPWTDTAGYKRSLLARALIQFPTVDTVRIWGDDEAKAQTFVRMVEGLGRRAVFTHVDEDALEPLCAAPR